MSYQWDQFDALRRENEWLKQHIEKLEEQIKQQNEDRLKLARSC